ncbi:MAG: hypothetical protein M3Z24_08850 [Chloroflexota bacterium]|nr:hypothetical protein [Chloroflexota bacterium]
MAKIAGATAIPAQREQLRRACDRHFPYHLVSGAAKHFRGRVATVAHLRGVDIVTATSCYVIMNDWM